MYDTDVVDRRVEAETESESVPESASAPTPTSTPDPIHPDDDRALRLAEEMASIAESADQLDSRLSHIPVVSRAELHSALREVVGLVRRIAAGLS